MQAALPRVMELPGVRGSIGRRGGGRFCGPRAVIGEDVLVLIPFATQSWAASGLLVVAFRAPRGEECVSLIHIVDIYEVAVRVDPQKLGSRTHEAR